VGRHENEGTSRGRVVLLVLAMIAAGTAALTGAVTVAGRMGIGLVHSQPQNPADCPRVARVVAATSFAPVLRSLAPELAKGDQCVRVDLVPADGRSAATVAQVADADVWIPDDTAWEHLTPPGVLPPDGVHGAGTVVATSPIYMVTDAATASQLGLEGATWLGLATLLQSRSDIRLVVKDPAAFGDGMVGVGSVAEAVWTGHGMDASAVALEKIVPKVRTTPAGPALPQSTGDVGVVPEYALLPALSAGPQRYSVLPGGDFVAELRFTFFPTARAVADPRRAAAVDTLRTVLTGKAAPRALDAAGLRPPGSSNPPTAGRDRVPALGAPALGVLGAHHVDHVFASWYRNDRRLSVTMVVDVSWSMSDPAPGSSGPIIDLVRRGGRTVGEMLPNASRVGVWVFGSHLSGAQDYRVVLPIGPLTAQHRRTLADTMSRLQPEHTGTGLYDTILAAYTSARNAWTAGQSNQVMVFTDGINDDDPGSISLPQLTQALRQTQDSRRPVQLSVVGFGAHAQLDELSKALDPVGGYVESLKTADQVQAMFIHLATGGLHAEAVR
jgi:Bacterial extracellular solute-binding protein/von Willebrand factor type A domain